MVTFDDGVLSYQKIKCPDLHINIMSDVQESYRNYLNSGIHEDIEYLQELIQNLGPNFKNYTISGKVGNLVNQTYRKTQTVQANTFYPVIVTLRNPQGQPVGEDRELLRIPFMDDYCKLNVSGESKVILSCLRSAEDISYNLEDKTFNIAMPHANIRITTYRTGVKVRFGRNKFKLDVLISAMLGAEGSELRLTDIFKNTYLLNTIDVKDQTRNEYMYKNVSRSSTILDVYKSVQYRLGDTRAALNEALQLDRALGETLSRDTLSYKAGTVITQEMISDFKRNRITVLYVQNRDIREGYRFGSRTPLIIREIPAGTKVGAYLRDRYPAWSDKVVTPVTIRLGQDDLIMITHGRNLSVDMIEFLVDLGITELEVHPGSSQTVLRLSFEKEITSNWTCRLKDVMDVIPAGRRANDWVYLYNNENLDDVPMDYMTAHDFIAILSIIGDINTTGSTTLLNRDNAFLKKVMMIGDLFSESLRAVLKEYFVKYRAVLANNLIEMNSDNPFSNVTKKWVSYMVKERFLSPIDALNLISEVSQVNHINTLVASGAEVVDKMRHIAMPFYGRICPFETPAGKKLGLVNTKAMGGRVRKGLLEAPYRKVIESKDGIRLSNNVTWLTAKDELKYKFGDALLLQYDEHGKIMNTPTLARIPNPDVSDEPFIVTTINAFELAGGFVDAFPEMSISPTVSFIPFLGSDDAIRISYAASQIRQSVGLHNSKKPKVYTPMYKDVFDYSSQIEYRSPCDGKCVSITNIEAVFLSDEGQKMVVRMQGDGHQGQIDQVVVLNIDAGDSVKKDDLIAVLHKYPQPFVVKAPFDGVITDINDTAISITSEVNASGFIDTTKCNTVKIENSRILGQTVTFMNIHVSVGDKVKAGDILADTSMSRDGIYTPSRSPLVAYVHTGYNYEDGVTGTERGAIDYTSVIAHKLDISVSNKYGRNMRPEPLNGFTYKAPGDIISNIKMYENGTAKDASRKKPIKATLKVNGIPYERRILKDDTYARVFRYNLLAYNKLKVGDKMTGRHGNKGVVSKIFKDSQSYQLVNGRTVEFMTNPCGVPSRMNLGQIDDAKFGLCATVLSIEIVSPAYNGATHAEVMDLMAYCYDVVNADGIGDNITKQYNRAAFNAVASNYPQYSQAFHDHVWNHIEVALDWTGVFNRNGDAYLYNPRTGKYLYNPVTIGYPCYLKEMQEVDEKLNVRSGPLDEQYARVNSQPQKSANSAKGQRMAEMEAMAYAAAGASYVIDEMLNVKSDNEGARVNAHLAQMGYEYMEVPQKYCNSRAVANLYYYMEALGVKMDIDEYELGSADMSYNSYSFDLQRLVGSRYHDNSTAQQTQREMSMLKAFEDVED